MRPHHKTLLFIVLLTLLYIPCLAQETSNESKSEFRLSGSLGFFYDYYSFSQENYATFRPRYPENLLRFNAQMTMHFTKHFSIPISVNVTNQEVLYTLPSVPEESLVDYIQNPANNISINPKYKWAQGFLGTQTPLYSTLTTGDIPIFGLGVELNPGKFIFSASMGTSQRAVEPDLSLNIPGAYKQDIMAARIGVGKLDGSKFTINMVRIKDDISSVNSTPIGVQPIEGVSISPLAEFKLFKKLQFKTETAASIYTSDLLNTASLSEDLEDIAGSFLTINASSTADLAHNTRIDWLGDTFQLGGEVQYIGASFLPVGYRFVERDILDYKINTSFKLFKNKVNLSGSFGVRTNNINDTKLSTSKRVISNANLFTQISDALSLNVNYSNFGFNNDANLLNQRIELVNNSLSLSPSYSIQSEKYLHMITGNLAWNSFEQFDVVSNAFAKAENNTYSINYNLSFIERPLNLGLQGVYVDNQLPTGDFKMLQYGLTGSYKLLNKKLTPSLAFNLAHIDTPGFTTDYRTNLNLKLGYKLTKKLQCQLQYRYTNMNYGSSRTDAVLTQNRLQFSIQQRF